LDAVVGLVAAAAPDVDALALTVGALFTGCPDGLLGVCELATPTSLSD